MSSSFQEYVLVTGAKGFIGRHVLSYLTYINTPVRSLTRNNKDAISLSDKSLVKKYCLQYKITTIIHLASMVKRIRTNEDIDNEVNIAVNLISSLKSGSKFIYFSTADIYADQNDISCEDSLISPVNKYAEAKLMAELALTEIANTNKIELIILRPSLVYGHGVPDGMFLSDLKQSYKEGKKFSYSSHTIIRDFIHINDVVKAVVKIINHDKYIGGIYNLSTGIGNSFALDKISMV